MSEQNDETQPVAGPPAETSDTAAAPPAAAPAVRSGWRERAYGIKGVAAVAIAGLVIGGGAGAAIHAATAEDGGRDGRPGLGRDGFGRDGGRGDGFGGPGGQMPGPGQMPGQLPGQPPDGLPAPPDGGAQPSTTPPKGSVSPDGSDDSTSSDNT